MSGSHPTDQEDWLEYVGASRRKIAIARDHLRRLEEDAVTLSTPREEAPIPVQANFEGILYSFIAAADQVAEAIRRVFPEARIPLAQGRRTLLDMALASMPESGLQRRLHEWRQVPIVDDVRWVRRCATHHYYSKNVVPGGGFVVQKPPASERGPHVGSRGLVEYARAAVEHAEDLGGLLEELEGELSRGGA